MTSAAALAPLVLGTVGPLASGKSTLMLALLRHFHSGDPVDTDRLFRRHGSGSPRLWKERPEPYYLPTVNPISIDYKINGRDISHVDTSGDPRHGHLALWGLSQMDAAILVVRADTGKDDSVDEALRKLRASGISGLILYINSESAEDDELAPVTELELREQLNRYDFRQVPIIRGHALEAWKSPDDPSLQALIQAIQAIPSPTRMIEAPALFRIAEVLSISGRGTVVIGRVEQGVIKPDTILRHGPIKRCPGLEWPATTLATGEDKSEYLLKDRERHGTQPVRIKSIERFRHSLREAVAGDLVGLLVDREPRERLKRGDFLAAPDAFPLVKKFKLRFGLFEGQGRALRQDLEIGVHVGAGVHGGLLTQKIDSSTGDAEIELFQPTILLNRDRLVLRQSGYTLGWARVTDVIPYTPNLREFEVQCPRCGTSIGKQYLEVLTTCHLQGYPCTACSAAIDKERAHFWKLQAIERERKRLLS